jgi:hypothetical protein
MIPFEVLYGRKCRFPISWDIPVDRFTLGPEFMKEMEHKMIKIRQNLKLTQDEQKSYADTKRTHKKFMVGDRVLRMETCAKLAPCYCGPFEFLERVGPIAYKLALPPTIKPHNAIHVSLLKKYVHGSNHVID